MKIKTRLTSGKSFFNRIHSLTAVLLLLLTLAPSAKAANIDEEEAGKWETIGTGQLIDGWVLPYIIGDEYKNNPIEVEIQQYKENGKIYRIWQPYKNIFEVIDNAVAKGAKRSTANEIAKSDYKGQIIFDITNPEYVKIGDFRSGDRVGNTKPAGIKVTKGGNAMYSNQFGFEGELYASTAYSFYMNQGMPESFWSGPSDYYGKNNPIIYTNGGVSVEKTFSVDSNLSGPYNPRNYSAFIYFPTDYNPDDNGEETPEVSDRYRWEDIISYPDNKYFLATFDTQSYNEPQTESGAYAPFPALGGKEGYPAQIIKNYETEDGQKVLRIFFTQLYRNLPYEGNVDWRPHFMLAKNSDDICYPADFSSLNLGEDVHTVIPESGIKYDLSAKTYPITSGSGDNWLSHDHFLLGENCMYDVVITIYFDIDDEQYDKPLAIKFDYKDSAPEEKAFFIGSLTKTSSLYDEEKDNLGGYMTRVPFDTNDYPFTYTFRAEEEEYEFILFHKYPYWMSKGPDFYKVFFRAFDYDNFRFHNEMGSGLEPLTRRIANDLEEGVINRYPGYEGLPHKDSELGVSYKNSIHYTPFHLKNLEVGKIYQIKFDEPDLLYSIIPAFDWVLNSELDDYFNEKGIDISNLKDYYVTFDIDVILPGEEERFDDSYLTFDKSKNPRPLTTQEEADVKRVPLAKRLDRDARYQVLKGLMYKEDMSFLNLYYTEYTPVPETYQLVQSLKLNENTGDYEAVKDAFGNNVYYTYDYTKEKGKTYKVTLDKDFKVASFDVVKTIDGHSIDESVEYKDPKYNFSDFLFIVSTHPTWIQSAYVNDKITGIIGKLKFKDTEDIINFDTTKTFDPEHLHEVVKMKNVDGPLDVKDFDIEYSYTYSNRYQGVHVSMYDTSLPTTIDINYLILSAVDSYHTGELETDYFNGGYKLKIFNRADILRASVNSTLSANIPQGEAAIWRTSESTVAVGSVEGLENPTVETTGRLTVPEPMDLKPIYSLSTDNDAKADSGNSQIEIHFYAEDLVDDNYTVDYLTLPELKIHSHDYHITFPYVPSNVTLDLGNVMNAENANFSLIMHDEDNKGAGEIILNPENGISQPGYFNADLGYIYDRTQNKPLEAHRTLTLAFSGDPEIVYYRWNGGVDAETDLDLTAPEVSTPEVNNHAQVGRWIRPLDPDPENAATCQWEEVLYIDGTSIVNTADHITEKSGSKPDGDLITGDDAEDHTTLYLLEILDLDNEQNVKERILATKEEIEGMKFDVYRHPDTFLRDEWLHDFKNVDGSQGYIDLTQFNGKVVKPFRLRNVYLFPIANNGFMMSDNTTSPYESADDDAKTKSIAMLAETAPTKGVYHGVTTPVAEVEVILQSLDEGVTSDVEIVESDSQQFAKAGYGYVEVLVDGAELYTSAGKFLGAGKALYHVNAGVYVVRLGGVAQKVVVKG